MKVIPAEEYQGYYNRVTHLCRVEWTIKDTLMFVLHQYVTPIIAGCAGLTAFIMLMVSWWHSAREIPFNTSWDLIIVFGIICVLGTIIAVAHHMYYEISFNMRYERHKALGLSKNTWETVI